jgi:uncharacterized protein (DUF58 family)
MIPPRTGRRQALRILHATDQIAASPAGERTDLGRALGNMVRMLRRRSLVFLISDFLSADGWESPLRQLAQRHDVIAVRVVDPAERELPDVGMMTLQDPETGEQVRVDTSDARVRRAYRDLVAQRDDRLRRAFRQAGVDALSLSTHESLVGPLVRFAAYRRRRRWSSPGR